MDVAAQMCGFVWVLEMKTQRHFEPLRPQESQPWWTEAFPQPMAFLFFHIFTLYLVGVQMLKKNLNEDSKIINLSATT